ncbi:terpenoid synthase [Mycena latifolia]|nr:terpenoid synthase [Mycena latifolia]
MSDITLIIPDTLRSWPWPRVINPYYAECKKESSAWCEGFHAFDSKAQKAFNLCDFNLLASLAYPLLNKEGCRVGCDLMNLFFVIDEHTDVASTETAREQADIVMDAIRNPCKARAEKEWIGGEVARQFWLNGIRTASPTSQRRFIDTFQSYMDAVVQEADDRNSSRIRDVKSYFEVRRDTIGAKPSFAICELHMNIPDDVNQLTVARQARGDDGHNLVRIVMHQYNISPQQAMNWISDLHETNVNEFLALWASIPTFGGPLDREVRTYADGLGNWVRANDAWSLRFVFLPPETDRKLTVEYTEPALFRHARSRDSEHVHCADAGKEDVAPSIRPA